jgi:hypothetical protein
MQTTTPNAIRKRKELVKDELAYVDSVAKEDINVLETMLQPGNEIGNVARIFIGGSDKIPSRALGYLASAIRVAQLVPVTQLQVVSVANLGSRINKVDQAEVSKQFKRFASVSAHLCSHIAPDFIGRLTFVVDKDTDAEMVEAITPIARKVIGENSTLLSNLLQRGQKHGGDPIAYAAAHFVYQDTQGLEVAHVLGPDAIRPERVISVGCLQEKIFFQTRSLIRAELSVSDPLPNVQVFSLHTSAPYLESNGGEQPLDEVSRTQPICFESINPSTQRDLDHLSLFLGVQNHGK